MSKSLALVAALLVSCAQSTVTSTSVPERRAYGAQRNLTGIYDRGFELSSFDGCSLEFTKEAGRDLIRLVPDLEQFRETRIIVKLMIQGRKTLPTNGSLQSRYGHLGMFGCQIQASKVFSAKVVQRGF